MSRPALLLGLLCACGTPEPSLPAWSASSARSSDVPLVPTCTISAPECIPAGLAPDRCVSDPAPFLVTEIAGVIVDVSVDPGALATLELAPGKWWTAFADPLEGCDWRVVEFEVVAIVEGA